MMTTSVQGLAIYKRLVLVSVPLEPAIYLAASSIDRMNQWKEMPVLVVTSAQDVCESLSMLLDPRKQPPCLWLDAAQKSQLVCFGIDKYLMHLVGTSLACCSTPNVI